MSLHRTAIEAAVTAGVGRVLYTSHQGAALTSPFRPGRDHATLTWLAGPWRETGVITVPADGPVSWTAREDQAEAAAVILASGGAYDGPTTLTAGEALTFHEVATIASELTGRPITCEVIDPDAWIAAQIAPGRPEFVARFTLGMYQAANQGYFAGTDPLLAALLQRAPSSVRDTLSRQPSHTAS